MAAPRIPHEPLSFIRDCIRARRILWTYHVNMRLEQRSIPREMIIQAAESYEMVEGYPDDKYLPSYLLLGRCQEKAFHVLFAADIDEQNVRIVTAYYPSLEEWEADLKTRRRSQ